jgi:hypothetical protein
MSAARQLSFESEVVDVLERILKGELIHCLPKNPFYDLDLSVLVALDQIDHFAAADPIAILGEREKSFRFQIWGLDEKQEILNQTSQILDAYKINRSLKEDCLQCADELITNSIFNAPFGEKKDRKVAGLKIPGSTPVSFDISVGETDLVICCVDPFGSLKIAPFFEKILNCYKSGIGESINYGDGGAGIGSFMILEQSISLILGIVPSKRTAFYCRFPLKMSSKIRKTLPKNIIVFNRED